MQLVSGTIISYYFICKRKLWLHANRINLEDNSEDVRIGKVLHEIAEQKGKSEIKLDNVVIDKLTRDYLVEIKKSDSDPEAVKWQVLLYLYTLKQKGIERKGRIEYVEKLRGDKKTETVELTDENEAALLEVLASIERLVEARVPPAAVMEPKCKKCAYYEYCFI